MEKQQIISFIKAHLEQGQITEKDLISIARGLPRNVAIENELQKTQSWNMINTLYIIGSVVGIIGIGILVNQHWDAIGFLGRILVTIGISFMTYIIALLLCKSQQQIMSQVMFFVSAMLAPLGVFILLSKFEVAFTLPNQAMTAAVLFIVFACAQYVARNSGLVIILTGLGTWAYYALLAYIFSFSFYSGDNIIEWATIILGITYILIAYSFSKKDARVMNVLYGFGTLAILGAGISLGGIWDFIFILFVFAAFYGSVYIKSQMVLVLGAIFLVAYIGKITYRYFLDSIGWPVALIACGVLIVAIGYLTFEVNQRFLKEQRTE